MKRNQLPNLIAIAASFLLGIAPLTAKPLDLPVVIKLDKPQRVTVVIENDQGVRVCNLVADTLFPAGSNVVHWDGYDDGTRNAEGDLVRKRVPSGTYTARGLTHEGIELIYEFPLYAAGETPWENKEFTGAWLGDHSVALGAVYLPARSGSPYGDGQAQVLLSCLIAEAGRTMVWVGLDGKVLQRRSLWGWDGAQALAHDAGPGANPKLYAYLVNANATKIKLRALAKNGSGTELLVYTPQNSGTKEPIHEGHSLAVHDGLSVFNAPTDGDLVFADLATRKTLGKIPLPGVRGLAFDAQGRLLVSGGKAVARYTLVRKTNPDGSPALPGLTQRQDLITTGLQDPRALAFSPDGSALYVSDWGDSHQVKVFSSGGKPLRVIGKANDGSQLGLYDEAKMQRPLGLAVDGKNQVWVAEANHLPKRVSVWNASSGALQRAFYGPPHYGGGGTIDPTDKTRAFYETFYGLMEFKLDWQAGVSKLHAILVNGGNAKGRSIVDAYGIEYGHDPKGGPSRWGFVNERPTHVNGRTYFLPSWQSGLRNNDSGVIWMLGEDHVAWPVARIGGSKFTWPPQLNQAWKSVAPARVHDWQLLISWADLNGNHTVDADEYRSRHIQKTWTNDTGKGLPVLGITAESVNPDLSMISNWGLRVPPPTFDAKGIPSWDLAAADFLVPPHPAFEFNDDGKWGQQMIQTADGWVVASTLIGGWKDKRLKWTYPVEGYPSNPALRGGDVHEPTRLLGPPNTAASGEAGSWFAVNGERGNIFLLTGDGLFLQTLGGDMRNTPLLRYPTATRGMVVDSPQNHVSFEDEHFHPTITQTKDGEIYLVAGKEHSSIFRVKGFENVRRREFGKLELSGAAIASLPEKRGTKARKQGRSNAWLNLLTESPVVDGNLSDWGQGTSWQDIGDAGQAAVSVSGGRLFAAFKTSNPKLLENDAVNPTFMFKNGGGVDLMIGTDLKADPKRTKPVPGDLRILVSKAGGKPTAVLYRAMVPGTVEKARVLFESPIGKVWFDRVEDISGQLQLAQSGGNVEFSVPLSALGFAPQEGKSFQADFGILRGNGSQTVQRIYWSNNDTHLVSDIPSEARLQPANWGLWNTRAFSSTPREPDPVTGKATLPGLRCEIFKPTGDFNRIPDFSKLPAPSRGTVDSFTIPATAPKNAALRFSGYITVPKDGFHSFYLRSDAESRLYIGDRIVVRGKGNFNVTCDGDILLKAGQHAIRVEYVNDFMPAKLQVAWQGPGWAKTEIGKDSLWREP